MFPTACRSTEQKDKPKPILHTGTRGRSWKGELSYLPREGAAKITSLDRFDDIHARFLSHAKQFDTECPSLKNIKRAKTTYEKPSQLDDLLVRTDKEIKKDKESFRTTLVNIVMQNIQSDNENKKDTEQTLEEIMNDVSNGDTQDKDKMQRYYYYITNGVDTQHVAEMEERWLSNVLRLIPQRLKNLRHSVHQLSLEMREDYHMGVKKLLSTLY
ncbi:hypothetical protein MT418_002851 [Batrachochytrium dendrobatidis]